MNEKKKIDKVFLEQPFRSKKKFIAGKISVTVFLLIATVTVVLTTYYWQSIAWYVKIILSFFVFGLAPDIEDIKFLKMPYDVYKEEWEEFHEKKNKA